MRKLNLPLILGSVFLVFLVIVILFPDAFATQSPYTIQHIRFSHVDGELDIERAPFAPDKHYLLGSDHLGRDIYSYIVYGTGLTITMGVLIALSQFALAVPMALISGFGNKIFKRFIEKSNVLFSAIPALLIALILLNLDYFKGLEKFESMLAFVVVLTAVNWARLGVLVLERVESIIMMPFIRGEVAIGKSKLKIATENVIPHLAPELMVLFFMEIARSLSFLMQLGIFAVFIGNLGLINDPAAGVPINLDISYEPEWSSMLSTSRTLLTTAPWAVVFPALAFFVSVLGFNLFGEGLRTEMQKKDSHSVQVFRKLFSLDIRFLWRLVKTSKLRYYIAPLVILVLGMGILNHQDYQIGFAEGSSLPATSFVGTPEAREVADFIAEEVAENGISPIDESGYLYSYDIGPASLILDQTMTLKTKESIIAFEANVDFTFTRTDAYKGSGLIYDARKMDLFTMASTEMFDHHFVLIDQQYYSDQAIDTFIDSIAKLSSANGILLVARQDEKIGNTTVVSSIRADFPVVEISREVADTLSEASSAHLSMEINLVPLESQGQNVIGIVPGIDPYIGDEAMVVGFGYNYMTSDGKEVLKFNLNMMKKISMLEGNKRTVIFVFFDGTLTEDQHGVYSFSNDYPYSSQKTQVFLDLTEIKSNHFDSVTYSSDQAPVTRQFSWSLGRHLEKQLDQKKFLIEPMKSVFIEGSYLFMETPNDNAMFWNRGIPSIILKTQLGDRGLHDLEKLGQSIIKSINDNNY